ncbi:hypothetical protein G6F57_022354 [Rhizopus arrhizus]|nr:hypothetical protein G6F57_022354 [Rhizopus arrhizus]
MPCPVPAARSNSKSSSKLGPRCASAPASTPCACSHSAQSARSESCSNGYFRQSSADLMAGPCASSAGLATGNSTGVISLKVDKPG